MANKITKLSLYTLALVALIAHLLDMSLFENRVFSFEKSLPFTQIITLYLNSSQYNFKIFYAILITTAVFTFRAKFLAPKVLICLPLTAKISYLPLAYYSNESLLKDVVNNELLQNNLNSIHPVLVYLIFAIALTFTVYQKKNKNTHILNKTNYVQIPLASFTLILGSWWALQEGTWGGWWDWDISEVFIITSAVTTIIIYHLPVTPNNKYEYSKVVVFSKFTILLYYLANQLSFRFISHTFVTLSGSDVELMLLLLVSLTAITLANLKNYGVLEKSLPTNLFMSKELLLILLSLLLINVFEEPLSSLASLELLMRYVNHTFHINENLIYIVVILNAKYVNGVLGFLKTARLLKKKKLVKIHLTVLFLTTIVLIKYSNIFTLDSILFSKDYLPLNSYTGLDGYRLSWFKYCVKVEFLPTTYDFLEVYGKTTKYLEYSYVFKNKNLIIYQILTILTCLCLRAFLLRIKRV